MYGLGLNLAQYKEFVSLLGTSHALRVEVDLLTLDHKFLGSLTPHFLAGQVDIDTEASVSRSVKLELYDRGDLNLDPGDPHDGSMYLDRMVQIRYCVGRMDGSRWYRVPVFTGPLTKLDRNGSVMSLEAQGKESLAGDSVWSSKTYGSGWTRTGLIKAIMGLTGETKFRFAQSSSKTTTRTAVTRGKHNPWQVSKKLASSLRMNLFYDGAGYLNLQPRTSSTVWTFNGENVLEPPEVGYDLGSVVNAVEVVGGKPKGSKKPVSYTAVAARNHPMSPWSLGRNGVPHYIWTRVEDSSLTTKSAVKDIALRDLGSGLLQSVDAALDVLPVPHIQEYDVFRVNLPEYTGSATIKKATLPLSSGSMSIGYTKRVTPPRLTRSLYRK